MKTAQRILAFLLCLFSLPAYAAAPQSNQHLCKEEDLIGGTWKMMTMSETPPRREAVLYEHVPYHYLAFYPDHYYAYVASDAEITTPAALQKVLQWPQPAHRILKYTLDNKGLLNLYLDKKMLYSYRCLAMAADGGGYRKNDLILTGYTRKKTQLYKLYRRWY